MTVQSHSIAFVAQLSLSVALACFRESAQGACSDDSGDGRNIPNDADLRNLPADNCPLLKTQNMGHTKSGTHKTCCEMVWQLHTSEEAVRIAGPVKPPDLGPLLCCHVRPMSSCVAVVAGSDEEVDFEGRSPARLQASRRRPN